RLEQCSHEHRPAGWGDRLKGREPGDAPCEAPFKRAPNHRIQDALAEPIVAYAKPKAQSPRRSSFVVIYWGKAFARYIQDSCFHVEGSKTINSSDQERIKRGCTRFLIGHYPQRPDQVLKDLAEIVGPDEQPDHYGEGEIMTRFEQEVAQVLGKEAAVFMPSG